MPSRRAGPQTARGGFRGARGGSSARGGFSARGRGGAHFRTANRKDVLDQKKSAVSNVKKLLFDTFKSRGGARGRGAPRGAPGGFMPSRTRKFQEPRTY